MTTDELRTLMNQEIDGRNAPAESTRLRELLAADHAARREFTDLQEIASMLDRMESRTPPPDLTPSILSMVRNATTTAAPAPRRSWWPDLAGMLRRPQALRLAYVFVAGAGLGIVGTLLFRGASDPATLRGVSATLAPLPSSRTSGDIATTPLRFDGGTGVARLRRTPDGFVVVVEVVPAGAARPELHLEAEGADLRGYRIENGTMQRLEAGPEGARWIPAGPGTITWYLSVRSREGAAVTLTAGLEGGEAFRTNFLVPAE